MLSKLHREAGFCGIGRHKDSKRYPILRHSLPESPIFSTSWEEMALKSYFTHLMIRVLSDYREPQNSN